MGSKLEDLFEYKPYTWRTIRHHLFLKQHEILFEDNPVMIHNGSDSNVTTMVELLNSAYRCGAMSDMARNK